MTVHAAHRKITDPERKIIIEMAKQRISHVEIAKTIGRPQGSVSRVLRKTEELNSDIFNVDKYKPITI